MREGWLTAVRDPSSVVHGVLWDLALSDIPALDRYEALPQGLYIKQTQPVIAEHGPKRAIVYFGANSGPGVLRPAYIAEVLAAAQVMAASGGGRRGAGAGGLSASAIARKRRARKGRREDRPSRSVSYALA